MASFIVSDASPRARMSSAFGDARTLPASDQAKTILKQLVTKNLFNDQRHAWALGASLGIASGKVHSSGKRGTFQNINSLDPDGILAATMVGLYPNLTQKERREKLVDHAEWGIREINRKEQNGTLDFSTLGLK